MDTILHTVLREKEALMAERGSALYRVSPDATIDEAVRLMNEANVGCVLVMEGDQLVGIFSERDLMRLFTEDGQGLSKRPVSERMTSKPITVPPSMSVEDALLECTDRRVRHLPVVEEGQLLGLLSIGDLVRFVVKDKEGVISELMDYIHGP